MGSDARGPPEASDLTPLSVADYLAYFSSRMDDLFEDRRSFFSLSMIFAGGFVTSLIAILTSSQPALFWYLAAAFGLAGSAWFYLLSYFATWSAFQFDLISVKILAGRIRSAEAILALWSEITDKARRE